MSKIWVVWWRIERPKCGRVVQFHFSIFQVQCNFRLAILTGSKCSACNWSIDRKSEVIQEKTMIFVWGLELRLRGLGRWVVKFSSSSYGICLRARLSCGVHQRCLRTRRQIWHSSTFLFQLFQVWDIGAAIMNSSDEDARVKCETTIRM